MMSETLRVFWALVAREILTRYGRKNLGFLWLFIEPMLFSVAIAALWSAIKGPVHPTMSVAGFALTGYATVLLWRYPVNRTTIAMKTNWALLYHPQVTPLLIYMSRIFIEIVAGTASFFFMACLFCWFDLMVEPQDLFGVFIAWLFYAFFAVGFSLTIGALAFKSELVERLWHMVSYLLFPLSGVAFLVDWIPPQARPLALLNPMVHGVELLRHAWFGVPSYADEWYFLLWSLILLAVGIGLVQKTGRVVEP